MKATEYPLPIDGLAPAESTPMRVVGPGGVRLWAHGWFPEKSPRSILVLLHGIGMHGGPYRSVARAFTVRQIGLVVPDLRGHGRSEGRRHSLPDMATLTEDLDRIFAHVSRLYPGVPIALGGESMGGLLAAEFVSRRPHRPWAVVLLCPAFRVHPSRFIFRGLSTVPIGRIHTDSLAHLEPSTRMPGFVTAKRNDPDATHTVHFNYLLRLAAWGWRWPWAAARIPIPLQLHLPGRDRIIDNRVARQAFARWRGSPSELLEWDDAYHTLFWDPSTGEVVDRIAGWLLERLSPPVGAEPRFRF